MGKLQQNYLYIVGMQNFQDAFKTQKQLFVSAFSICLTVPLNRE